MIHTRKAAEIIHSMALPQTIQTVKITEAVGRVLKEDIRSDRALPPFDRVMMDGIALQFASWKKGISQYTIADVQLVGEVRKKLQDSTQCIEIMTGAPRPANSDTVVRYGDIEIYERNGKNVAHIKVDAQKKGKNIHLKGLNRQKGEVLLEEGIVLGPAEIGVAATVGKKVLKVARPPRVAVISTGDELVDIDQKPLPYQIRCSNSYTLSAALQGLRVKSKMVHLPDDKEVIRNKLATLLQQYEVLILSGGVSKGKRDYIPGMLEEQGVQKLFYTVRQRPGKPFWFGKSEKTVVFALPGNPVASFCCYYRYIEPWLKKQLGYSSVSQPVAQLARDYTFAKPLTRFLQVQTQLTEKGVLQAIPVAGKGSSDLVSLCRGKSFLELPEQQSHFKTGECYPLYAYLPLSELRAKIEFF